MIGALPPTTGKRKDGNPGRLDKTTAIYSCGPYQPGREEPDENLEREEELPEECDPPLKVEPVK